jgi:hypothetical protein
MVELYIRTVKEHLKSCYIAPEGLGQRLSLFLLAKGASMHDTKSWTLASLVFRREPQLPCNLLFQAPPNKEQPTINHAVKFVDHLHDIHYYACQHLKPASDRMKTCYDRLANCTGYHEGVKV